MFSGLVLALLAPALPVQGAVTFTGTYSENFDSLGTGGGAWTNQVTLPGWSALTNVSNTPTAYVAVDGSASSFDQVLNAGTVSAPDRALASQTGTTSGITWYGLALVNGTDATIQELSVAYTGEQWRKAGNDPSDSLSVDYQVFAGAGALNAASGWTAVPSLTFNNPVAGQSGGTSTALDGNDPANREALSGTLTGLNWAPGQTLWLRWTDANGSLSRHMLGIDDVSIGFPAPVSFALKDFSYDASTGESEASIEGSPNTAYKLVEADDLDFTTSEPVTLTGATVGTLSGNQVITDENGNATVQFNLGTNKDATFIRAENGGDPVAIVQSIPDLVALWTFQEDAGEPREAIGQGTFPLMEKNGSVARVQGGVFGDYAARLEYSQWFELAREQLGALNITGAEAQVTVVAWLQRFDKTQDLKTEAIAGVWDEERGKRQYALFLALPVPNEFGQQDQVGGHISAVGGPTEGFPFSTSRSVGATPVPFNQWVTAGFTYDGEEIRSYFNGEFDPLEGANPYPYPDGIFDGGEDGSSFTVGSVPRELAPSGPGNFFVGVIGGIAVYDRALTEQEMRVLGGLIKE